VSYEGLLKLASITVTECALCGAKDVEVMGCFVPEQSEAERYWPTSYWPTKLKPGEPRLLWYGLCSICEKMPRGAAACLVEDRMERRARAARQ
jgi:hypothetical protein